MTRRRLWTNAKVVTGRAGVDPELLEISTVDGRIAAVGAALSRAGGGIASTVRATRGLEVVALKASALPRLDALLAEGTSTIKIKSGYVSDIETELTRLRAAQTLANRRTVRIVTTWLAANAMRASFPGSKPDYMREVRIAGLERAYAEGLVDSVDAFCETITFSPVETRPLFDRAHDLSVKVKPQAEQLSHSGGAQFAAEFGAPSVDHFEYGTAADVTSLKAAKTAAVLLPGAFYLLREAQLPPIMELRQARVPIAPATDCDPATPPLTSLLLTMNMAATLFRMTIRECFEGVTRQVFWAFTAKPVLSRPGIRSTSRSGIPRASRNCSTALA